MADAPEQTRLRIKDGFRPDIEGLRGVAVALVVLFHAGLLSNAQIQLRGGFIGVDLFFVVSGFLITGLLIRERERTGRIGFSHFYSRRVRRILPAAAATLAITIPVAYKLLAPVDRPAAMRDAASAALSIANVRFALTTDYFNPVSYSPFLHFWSLGVEEQFYFLWPALMAVAAWKSPRLGAGLALAAVAAISFAVSLQVSYDNATTAFYILPTRAWQLAAGGLLAISSDSVDQFVRKRRPLSEFRALAGWAALAGLLVAATAIDSSTTLYPGLAALVPTAAGVILITAGSEPHGPGLLMRAFPVRFLGKISYSLYLWHWPILILGGIWLVGPLGVISPGQAVALVALSVIVSTVSWTYVEEPFRHGQISWRASHIVASGVAVMVALALVGSGLDWRAAAVTSTGGSHLRPTVADAANDTERPAKDGCLVGFSVVEPRPTCSYASAPGAYTVALVGDSHASELFPAVEDMARKHGWRIVTYLKMLCPFYDIPVYNSILKRQYAECSSWNENVIKSLESNPPDLVLLAMARGTLAVDPNLSHSASEGTALAGMIKRVPSATEVVIVEDPPLPISDVPTCLSANPDDFHRCDYPRTVGFRTAQAVREHVASTATGAPSIDLAPQVCPGTGACPVVIDNMIVWRDSNHLTATFSRSLGPALDAKLMAVQAAATPGR